VLVLRLAQSRSWQAGIMKKFWGTTDSSDRLSAIVLAVCVICLVALVLFR